MKITAQQFSYDIIVSVLSGFIGAAVIFLLFETSHHRDGGLP